MNTGNPHRFFPLGLLLSFGAVPLPPLLAMQVMSVSMALSLLAMSNIEQVQ